MMDFKSQIKDDLDIFFNDFAEPHNINGCELNILIDNERLMERTKKEFDGLSVGELLYVVKASDYGEAPEVGEPQKFDQRQMYIADIKISDGIYEIIITQNIGG